MKCQMKNNSGFSCLHNNLRSFSGDVYFKNTGSWYIWCWILCTVVCNVVTAYLQSLATYNVYAMTCNTLVLVCDFHSHIDTDTVLLVLAPRGSGLCWHFLRILLPPPSGLTLNVLTNSCMRILLEKLPTLTWLLKIFLSFMELISSLPRSQAFNDKKW